MKPETELQMVSKKTYYIKYVMYRYICLCVHI